MELFELYKNLSVKEKIKFDIRYNILKKEEELKRLSIKENFVDDLSKIVQENGESFR